MAVAGWYEDPSGTFVQRYWNGTTWTNHIVDDTGARGIDRPRRQSRRVQTSGRGRTPGRLRRPEPTGPLARDRSGVSIRHDLTPPGPRRLFGSSGPLAPATDERDPDTVPAVASRRGYEHNWPVDDAARRPALEALDLVTYGGLATAVAGLSFVGWIGEITAPAMAATTRSMMGLAALGRAFDPSAEAGELELPSSLATSYFDLGWLVTLAAIVWVAWRQWHRDGRTGRPAATLALIALAGWAVGSTLLFKTWIGDTFDTPGELGVGFYLTVVGLIVGAVAPFAQTSRDQ